MCLREKDQRERRYTLQILNTLQTQIAFSLCSASKMVTLKMYSQRRVFSSKGKYSCGWTDCCLLAQLDCASPECNFLPTGLKKKLCLTITYKMKILHIKMKLLVICTQMCVIGNTAYPAAVALSLYVCVCVKCNLIQVKA